MTDITLIVDREKAIILIDALNDYSMLFDEGDQKHAANLMMMRLSSDLATSFGNEIEEYFNKEEESQNSCQVEAHNKT